MTKNRNEIKICFFRTQEFQEDDVVPLRHVRRLLYAHLVEGRVEVGDRRRGREEERMQRLGEARHTGMMSTGEVKWIVRRVEYCGGRLGVEPSGRGNKGWEVMDGERIQGEKRTEL